MGCYATESNTAEFKICNKTNYSLQIVKTPSKILGVSFVWQTVGQLSKKQQDNWHTYIIPEIIIKVNIKEHYCQYSVVFKLKMRNSRSLII